MTKTITNRIQTLGAASVMVLALMVGMLFPQGAHAQSQEDLMQMINDLLAQIAALQAQVGGQANLDLQGEADLLTFDISPTPDSPLSLGGEDQLIAEATLNFRDGDAEIGRFDVAINPVNGSSTVSDYFESVAIWVDGDKVREEPVSNFFDNVTRLSQLGILAEENIDREVLIAATLKDATSTIMSTSDWTVAVNGVRYFDADGVATSDSTTGDLGESVGFTVIESGSQDKLKVSSSPNDPDAAVLQLDREDESDEYKIFAFELDAGSSEDDISIDWIKVGVALDPFDSVLGVIDELTLVIDGQEFPYSSGGGLPVQGLIPFFFDIDGDVVIDAGDQVEAELYVVFEALDPANEGMTITVSVDADDIDAEGLDDLGPAQLSGKVTGETHTLATQGIDVQEVEEDVQVNSDQTTGTFVVTVDVTAFEDDFYFGDGDMFEFEILGTDQNQTANPSISVETTADEGPSGVYFVQEGDTERFTLSVNYTPREAGTYRMYVSAVNYGDSSSDTDEYTAVFADEIVTPAANLQGDDSVTDATGKIKRISDLERPYVKGEAEGLDEVGFSIDNGDKVYGSGAIRVSSQGTWTHRVTENLYNGDYTLTLTDGSGNELDSEDFTVTNGDDRKEQYTVYIDDSLKRSYGDRKESYATDNCADWVDKTAGDKTVRCDWGGQTFFESNPSGQVQGVSTSAGPTIEDQIANILTELSAHLRAVLQ